jgi:hypothetical protein
MSAPSPLTLNRTRFDASFTADGDDATKRAAAVQSFSAATGLSSDKAKWLFRLHDNVKAVGDKLQFPSEDTLAVRAFQTLFETASTSGAMDAGAARHMVSVALELVPKIQKALLDSTVDPVDCVRILSSCVKFVCAVHAEIRNPNSRLGPSIQASTHAIEASMNSGACALAAAKLKQYGIATTPGTIPDATSALRSGKRAIGFFLEKGQGKVTFVELEIRHSLFGFGGCAAPKRGDNKFVNWKNATTFAQTFSDHRGKLAQIQFATWDDLPQPLKDLDGASNLQPHQQQSFLDAINPKWHEWEDAYKTAHPGGAADEKDVLARKIIEQEIVKEEIAKMVTAATAVPEPQPEPLPT